MEQIIHQKGKFGVFIDYFLLTSIIALTGFEYFFRSVELLFYVVGPLSVLTFIIRKGRISSQFLLFIAGYCVWSIVQIIFGNSQFSALFNFGLRFFIYYFVAASLGADFGKRFIKIVVCISVISLVCYAISNSFSAGYAFLNSLSVGKSLGGGIGQDITSNPGTSLIFYYLPTVLFMRNPGPFWEPGMFAVFINLALALSLISTKKHINFSNIVLIITSITTFSTTSIIATALVLSIYYIFIHRHILSVVFILAISIGGSYFLESEYGIEKIKREQSNSDISSSRFGAMHYHFQLIKQNPIVGRGFGERDTNTTLELSPNGLTNIIVFFGGPFAIIFYCIYFYAFRRIARSLTKEGGKKRMNINTMMVFVAFITVSFSQDITTRHFAYLLAMYALIDTKIIVNTTRLSQ